MSLPKKFLLLLIAILFVVSSRRSEATITDIGFAGSVPSPGAHDGWDYVERAIGSASGKACTSGPSGESARGTASYDPGNNSTYWFPAWDFDPGLLPSRPGMHITAVEVDVNGSNGQVTGGNINIDIGVSGTNVTTTTTNRIWSGSNVACNWFSTKSGQPRWNVTSAINSLDINTVRAMRVRVKRHSNAGTPGSNTYYDIFVRAFLVQVTWTFDPPLAPTNVRKTQVCANSTTIGWDNNAGNQVGRVCGYEIWRSMDGGPFQVVVPDPNNCTVIWLPEGTTAWMDGSTLPGHTYVYQIRAHGEGGVSGWVTTPVGSINWVNAAGGSWNTASNWDQNRLPVSCDFVTISAPGSYTVTLPAQTTEIQGIVVGGSPGFQALSVSGGTFRVSAAEAITAAPGTGEIRYSGTTIETIAASGPSRYYGDQYFWDCTVMNGAINFGTLRVGGNSTVYGNLVNEVGGTVLMRSATCCNGFVKLTVTGQYQNRGSTILDALTGNFDATIDARDFLNEGSVTFEPGGLGVRLIKTDTASESPAAYGFRNLGTLVANWPGRITSFRENAGSVTATKALTFENEGSGIASVTSSGNVSVPGTGSIVVAGSNFTNSNSGTLTGPGSLSFLPAVGAFGLVNSGTLWPAGAGAIGKLSCSGSFTQTASGHLHVNLGGTGVGTTFDQLECSGTASLGGTLDVHYVNGFVPPAASGFHVLSSNGSTGTFVATNIPALPSGALQARYTDPGVALLHIDGLVGVEPGTEPARFHLDPPFPSPARGVVSFRFGVEKAGMASIEIVDARGRSLRTLVRDTLDPGSRTVVWDGRDDRGTSLGAGKYFVRLSAHDRQTTRPVLLLR